MSKRAWVAVSLVLIAGACSGGKEAKREDEPATAQVEPTAPKTGILTSVTNQRIVVDPLDDPGTDTELFERTTRSVAIRDGREIRWEELQEGDVVRVTWDRGVFGPDRVARVEVLSEEEAEAVRSRMMNETDRTLGDPLEPQPAEPPSGWPEDGMDPGY